MYPSKNAQALTQVATPKPRPTSGAQLKVAKGPALHTAKLTLIPLAPPLPPPMPLHPDEHLLRLTVATQIAMLMIVQLSALAQATARLVAHCLCLDRCVCVWGGGGAASVLVGVSVNMHVCKYGINVCKLVCLCRTLELHA